MMRQRAVGALPRTDVICAIVFDEDDSSGFGGRILRGMNAEGEALGSEIVMVTHCHSRLPLIASRRQVDGVIRMLGDIEVAKGVSASPVPWVSVLYDVPGIDLVTVDNAAGAREVGRYVCARGHRRLAFIGPDTDLARERLAGLREAAGEAGGEVPDELVRIRPFAADETPTRELLDELLNGKRPLPFTALVGYNDFMADVALQVARESGLQVPGDLSIAGFDGVLPSRRHEQRVITTAAIPLEELGAAAVRLLTWRLSSPDAPRRKVILETELVEGETVEQPAAR
jgi:LacI family transcriptional regulator